MSEKLCLQWNDFKENLSSAFGRLGDDTEFVDVTLACEDGQQMRAHKFILAASPCPSFLTTAQALKLKGHTDQLSIRDMDKKHEPVKPVDKTQEPFVKSTTCIKSTTYNNDLEPGTAAMANVYSGTAISKNQTATYKHLKKRFQEHLPFQVNLVVTLKHSIKR